MARQLTRVVHLFWLLVTLDVVLAFRRPVTRLRSQEYLEDVEDAPGSD